ncbi:MAG: DUF63 family protein [Methanimicrococcus sp.]|nr:DUF63 family protein [Methanimicrococcus sp.]
MSFIDSVIAFVREYYIEPVINDSGYNIFNTVTWAIVLGLSVYLLIYFFQKKNIKIDTKFMGATLPYVIAGATLRVVADSGAVSRPFLYLLITPNIYFFVFLLVAVSLAAALLLEKYKFVKTFRQPYTVFGCLFILIVCIILFTVCTVASWWVPFAVAGTGLGILLLARLIPPQRAGKSIFLNQMNLTILAAHMMDATSTVIGIEFFGYFEKHVLPAYLIELTGTAFVMYPLKLFIFLLVVLLLDKGLEKAIENDDETDKEQMGQIKNAIKFVIIILGLAPAIRNSIRLFFGI